VLKLLKIKLVQLNSHINVQMEVVLNLIFYVQLNNPVLKIILDVGTMNVLLDKNFVKFYLKNQHVMYKVTIIDVLMEPVQNHLLNAQHKLYVL